MSFEPEQIENLVDGQLPIPGVNAAFTVIRALLPTSAEKASLANGGGSLTASQITELNGMVQSAIADNDLLVILDASANEVESLGALAYAQWTYNAALIAAPTDINGLTIQLDDAIPVYDASVGIVKRVDMSKIAVWVNTITKQISGNGATFGPDGFGNLVASLPNYRGFQIGQTEINYQGQFVSYQDGFYIYNNNARFFLGLPGEHVILSRAATGALGVDGALLVTSADSLSVGLAVRAQSGGHIVSLFQGASGQTQPLASFRDAGNVERSKVNKTHDLETTGTRGYVTEDRTIGDRVKIIVDNRKIVLRSLDANNNESGTLGTISLD